MDSIDIWIQICQYLKVSDLIQMETVSRFFKNLIRSYDWDHEIIIRNINQKAVFETHHFRKFEICTQKITDVDLKWLANASVIDLAYCDQITHAGLAHLSNVQVLNLCSCDQITDAGLAYLHHAQTLNLSYCNKITDEGLAHLGYVQTLNLTNCRKITDAGFCTFTSCAHTVFEWLPSDNRHWLNTFTSCGNALSERLYQNYRYWFGTSTSCAHP